MKKDIHGGIATLLLLALIVNIVGHFAAFPCLFGAAALLATLAILKTLRILYMNARWPKDKTITMMEGALLSLLGGCLLLGYSIMNLGDCAVCDAI